MADLKKNALLHCEIPPLFLYQVLYPKQRSYQNCVNLLFVMLCTHLAPSIIGLVSGRIWASNS